MPIARGKGSAGPPTAAESPAASSSGSQALVPKTTIVQTRQRRIMPSRSRRGGPGVGSGDADLMILETLKRRHESEPLIPAGTQFLLTTNSSLAPSSSSGAAFEMAINTSAYDRYFDKPEVLRAYREQQTIQTPEYSRLAEHASVGGRFRPRGSEDEGTDTSDAAYEKRHRKYETFEKRQRLREKEKLKHEHYKLKERIDQLSSMDAVAFLTVPATSFSTDTVPEHPEDGDNVEGAIATEHPSEHLSPSREGEKRKRQMLDVAYSLEERYRTLLNPDHNRNSQYNTPRQQSVVTSVEPPAQSGSDEEGAEDEVDELEEEVVVEEPVPVKQEKLKFRIKLTPRGFTSASASPSPKPTYPLAKATFIPTAPRGPRGRFTKMQVSSPLASGAAGPSSPGYSASAPLPRRAPVSPVATRTSARFRGANGKKHDMSPSGSPDTRPQKRLRGHDLTADGEGGSPVPSADEAEEEGSDAEYEHTHGDYRKSLLYMTAMRSATAPNARHTPRHVTVFGMKPAQVLKEEYREFSIPDWAWPRSHPSFVDDEEEEGHYEEASSATYAKSDAADSDDLVSTKEEDS